MNVDGEVFDILDSERIEFHLNSDDLQMEHRNTGTTLQHEGHEHTQQVYNKYEVNRTLWTTDIRLDTAVTAVTVFSPTQNAKTFFTPLRGAPFISLKNKENGWEARGVISAEPAFLPRMRGVGSHCTPNPLAVTCITIIIAAMIYAAG
jgi:hypothetical protein